MITQREINFMSVIEICTNVRASTEQQSASSNPRDWNRSKPFNYYKQLTVKNTVETL